MNHFANKCGKPRERKTRNKKGINLVEVEDETSSDGEWINSTTSSDGSKDVKCRMITAGHEIVFQVDTGSSVNTLPAKYARNIEKTDKILSTWNGTRQVPCGVCRQNVKNPKNGKKYSVNFVVYEEDFTPLLGCRASQQMGLVDIKNENFERVQTLTEESLFKSVFDDKIGSLPGLHELKVNPEIKSVVMPNRRIPISVRSKLKDELDRLVDLNVIAPVTEPTPWVSQIVVAPKKNGKIRVCIDPRELNRALLREHYTLPILEDTLHEMGHSKVFSKADLSCGY